MQQSSEAIVLRRTDYGEADRIVAFLTPTLGKVSVLAKGVRKPASKLAAGIEPLSLSKITVRSGKGDLYTLTSAQMQTTWDEIIKDYDRLQLAYSVLKKINQVAETLQDPVLFELLKIALASLNNAKIDRRITAAWFHAQFLHLLGHGINLSRDIAGNKLNPEKRYRFSSEDTAFVEHKRGEFTADHLKVLKLLHLKMPAVIAQISGVEKVIDEVSQLLIMLNE